MRRKQTYDTLSSNGAIAAARKGKADSAALAEAAHAAGSSMRAAESLFRCLPLTAHREGGAAAAAGETEAADGSADGAAHEGADGRAARARGERRVRRLRLA